MQTFTGYEYLQIDIANHWGLDKMNFDDRVAWTKNNLDILEKLAEERGYWKEYPLFRKACMALRAAQNGEAIGHTVAFDAVASGMQIMSCLTGCKQGASVTGLVDQKTRMDPYTILTAFMSKILEYDFSDERSKVKNACMTALYGSKKQPENAFGEGTVELNSFYEAMGEMAPGPCELLAALIMAWQSDALTHNWTLPDGYEAKVKVMVKREERLEVDEVNSSFTYVWYENERKEKDVKLAANMVHSVDAYILRSLIRRCSYDPELVETMNKIICAEILERDLGSEEGPGYALSEEVNDFIELYKTTKIADVAILEHLDASLVMYLDLQHLKDLARITSQMLEHPPFHVITVHDAFQCHPNNMNALRNHYRQILADIADGDYLSHFFSEIHGRDGKYLKRSDDLGDLIRQSNYALC